MGIEQIVNNQLNKFPWVKKVVKRCYQLAMYAISPKIKSEGNIRRISPNDGREYFFGYYDKSPWDAAQRYMLCMRANDTWSDVSPREPAQILLIDTTKAEDEPGRVRVLAETRAWNVQMSCMLQWLGPDYQSRILFNDFRDGALCAVILDVETGEERVIGAPVYTVSGDGKLALTLDFSRLYSLRPGYGYYNIPEKTKGIPLPDETCIWTVDLESGEVRPLLKYTDFAAFQPRREMQEPGAVHKVNHLMLSPNGKRFMVLYRWFNGQRKYTRLITCNVDGSDMYILSDDDMVSHCFWKNDSEIIAFENKRGGGPGYYLMKDKSQEYIHLWSRYSNDGHPSYSPDRYRVVTDSYPNRARIAEIKVLKDTDVDAAEAKVIARVFAPFKYDNDTRCDLHPRWSRDGSMVCFDAVFEGKRGLYVVDVDPKADDGGKRMIFSEQPLVSCVIPTYKRSDMLTRAVDSVLSQTYENVEVLVVDDNEPGSPESGAVKELLRRYEGDNRVRYVGQEKHINGAVARNVGIHAAHGKYVAFLDDDDEWLPEKVEKQVAFLEENPQVGGCTCLYMHFHDGKETRRCQPYTGDDLQFKVLARQVAIFTSTFLGRKELIVRSGAFDPTLLRHQDLQFLADFLSVAAIHPIPEYLVKLHSDSAINRPNTQKLIAVKEAFFQAEKDLIESYDVKSRKRIRNAHHFEIVFSALKEKKLGTAVKYVLKVGFSVQAYKDVLARYKSRG